MYPIYGYEGDRTVALSRLRNVEYSTTALTIHATRLSVQ